MAFTTVRASGKYEDANSSATLTFSPSTDIEVGDTIAIDYETNVVHAVSSVADNSTQAGAANVYVIRPQRTGTVSAFGWVYLLKATRKILATDVITITMASAATRRVGHLLAVVSGNGNPRFEFQTGIANALASPVSLGATGALYASDSMAIIGQGWKGGAVASGFAQTAPVVTGGWVAHPSGGALSGGTTTRVESNVTYNLDIGSATTFTPAATYTSITVAHGEVLIFSDEPIDGRIPVVRSVSAIASGAFGSGLNANLPAFIQEDDLALAFVTLEESATLSPSPPTGWTSVGASVSVTGGGKLYCFWRKWVLGDTAPTLFWTPTTDGGEVVMVAIHCDTWDLSTPFEIYNTATEATVDTSWSYAPGTSTTVANTLCWAVYTNGVDTGSGQGSGTPTNAAMANRTGRFNANTAGGLGAGFYGVTGEKATTGSVGTWAQTLLTASAKAYASFAIRPAVGGGQTAITFTSAGTSTSSFALTRARPLTMTSAGVGTDAFAVSRPRPLTFTSAGVGTDAFALTRRRRLTLTSDGTSTSAFALTRRRALTMTSTGVGTDAFALARLRPLTMTSAGTSTSAFALARRRPITFTSAGVGTDTFTVTRRRPLTMTSAGVGTDAFALTRLRALAMTSAGVGTSSFALSRRRALTMTSAGTGTDAFTLTTSTVGTQTPITFASAGVGTSSFTLTRRRALAFTSAGTSTSAFSVTRLRPIAFTSAGAGTDTFTLTRLRPITFTSAGTSTTTFSRMFTGRSFSAAMLASAPDWYARLDETGSGPFVDVIAGRNATPSGTIVPDTSLLASDPDPSARFNPAGTLNKATTAYVVNGQPMTVAFLVKPASLTGSSGGASVVMSALPAAGTSGWDVAYIDTTGVWRLLLGNVAFYNFTAATKAQIGVLQHIAVVLTTTTVELFVNGVSQGTLATGTMLGPGGTLVIGGSNVGTGGRPNATIDEPALWRRAVTSSEIANLAALALGTPGAITFTSVGTSTTSFALTRARALTFASAGAGTDAFSLTRTRALAFNSTGVGTSTFNLSRRRALTFTSAGVGADAFALARRRALAFTSSGLGTDAFALTRRRSLSFNSTGAGASSFTLTRRRALTFASTGVGTSSFTLGVIESPTPLQGTLAVTVNASSTLRVLVTLHAELAVSVNRAPALAAGTRRRNDLDSTVDAAGNLTTDVS